MKFKDYFNFNLSAFSETFKGNKSDEDLEVELSTDTLEDGRVLAYLSLEEKAQVFLLEKDKDPVLVEDGTYKLKEQSITVLEGRITEVKANEIELSDEQKKVITTMLALDVATLESLVSLESDGYHTIEFSVQDGQVKWADMYSSTWKQLLSSDENPLKVELTESQKKVTDMEAEAVRLNAQIVLLQESDKQNNPTKTKIKLKDEEPLSAYEIAINAANK